MIDAVDKEAIEGVEVCAWSLPDEESFGCAGTDGAGSYTIGELEPGEYGVEFSPAGLSYLHQVYDGRTSWSEADPVFVGPGETSGIDAELVPTASIEGTVTAIEDGLPVEEVEVCALEAVSEEVAGCEYTGADGFYSIGPLDEGDYKVHFWPAPSGRSLALQFYDRESRWTEADAITLAEGETKIGVDAELAPAAVISGHVSSAASGLPLEQIRVCSIEALSGSLWTCTRTNSNGNYGLRHFAEGVYKIVFSLELAEWFGGDDFGVEEDGYPTEFWDDQTALSSANPISLATGEIAQGVDARLGPAAVPLLAMPPPAVAPRVVHRARKCRRGFRKKLVRGKRRCVRIHRRHRKRHRRPGSGARRSELLLSATP